MSNKEWTGNSVSTFKTLGASNHTDKSRETNDFYASSPSAIDYLKAKADIPTNVWECACGQGHLSKRLIELGHNVFSTDLKNRGYGVDNINFLDAGWAVELPQDDCCILTNPPYSLLFEFIEHSLEVLPYGAPAYFLIKTLSLEGRKRFDAFYSHGYLHCVYQFVDRLLCAKNGDFEAMRKGGGSAISYAWFEFRKTPCEFTKIMWLDKRVRSDEKSGCDVQPLCRQLNLFDNVI